MDGHSKAKERGLLTPWSRIPNDGSPRGGERMTLDDLILFRRIADRRSISKAAAELSMSQPSASRRLQAIERELGSELFNRSGFPLDLTLHGLFFLDFAESVSRQYVALTAHLSTEDSLFGTLQIATSSSPAAEVVSRWIADFVAGYPGVKVQLHEVLSRGVEEGLLNGIYHVGFMGLEPEHSRLQRIALAGDEIMLLLPRREPYSNLPDPLPWDTVRTLPFVWRTSGSGTMDTVCDILRSSGIVPRLDVALEVETGNALIEAVEAGVGVGFISRTLLDQRRVVRGRAVRLQETRFVRPFYLTYDEALLTQVPVAAAFVRYAHLRVGRPHLPSGITRTTVTEKQLD